MITGKPIIALLDDEGDHIEDMYVIDSWLDDEHTFNGVLVIGNKWDGRVEKILHNIYKQTLIYHAE